MDLLIGLANDKLNKKQRKIFIVNLNARQLSTIIEIVNAFLASNVDLKKTHLKTLSGCYPKVNTLRNGDLETKREILIKIPKKFWKILLAKVKT